MYDKYFHDTHWEWYEASTGIYVQNLQYAREVWNRKNYWIKLKQSWDIICDFDVLLTVQLSIFISVINQLDAQSFCFTISLFHASTCFEHMCSKHVEAWNKLIVKQKFCASSWLITEINHLWIYIKQKWNTLLGLVMVKFLSFFWYFDWFFIFQCRSLL